jgi:squalene-hopene/tetraprenyl-beta-curcumene cyclase
MSKGKLDGLTARAVKHCMETQKTDGSWVTDPDPRITETALGCLALVRSHRSGAMRSVERARRWLASEEPQSHDPVATALEKALKAMALQQPLPALDVRSPHPSRARLMHALAAAEVDGSSRDAGQLDEWCAEVEQAWEEMHRTNLKRWTQVEILAPRAILNHRRGDGARAADSIAELIPHQDAAGSFQQNPISTALAFIALEAASPGSPARTSTERHLIDTQKPDGTWRFCSSDVWDTTLMVRSASGLDGFDTRSLPKALGFLVSTQNADGGWGFRSGAESDNDTTSSALLALARGVAPKECIASALAYLSRMQTQEGLWRTWQYHRYPPVDDVVAHVVSALKKFSGMHRISLDAATRWLVERGRKETQWAADWYYGMPYAVAEVAAAVDDTNALARAGRNVIRLQTATEDGHARQAGRAIRPALAWLFLPVPLQIHGPDRLADRS